MLTPAEWMARAKNAESALVQMTAERDNALALVEKLKGQLGIVHKKLLHQYGYSDTKIDEILSRLGLLLAQGKEEKR
jgi:hypothetical protein